MHNNYNIFTLRNMNDMYYLMTIVSTNGDKRIIFMVNRSLVDSRRNQYYCLYDSKLYTLYVNLFVLFIFTNIIFAILRRRTARVTVTAVHIRHEVLGQHRHRIRAHARTVA